MALPLLMIVLGLIVLVWSAGLFVEGSARLARIWGMSPLVIGMVIIGFGTSAPEMTVAIISSWQGNPTISLGNAYGSNITNIALILGAAALVTPIVVTSHVIRKELPVLFMVTLLAIAQIYDGELSRLDAIVDLLVFALVMLWTVRTGASEKGDVLEQEIIDELDENIISRDQALVWTIGGLMFLTLSSRVLVWGAVSVAQTLGVNELVIGLTVVAIGTSLPELASSLVAAHKGENDLALGNIIGSNLFNTLAVVGLAGVIQPMEIPHEVLTRDGPLMALLTAALFLTGINRTGVGSINRLAGSVLLTVYAAYTFYLINTLVNA